ncbi:MAG TPA: BACON domain-containing protein [Bacteroidales bacterium]
MKNFLLIAALTLFFLSSCKKEEASVLKVDDSQSTLSLSVLNASTTLNLTSNVNWTITSDQQWCTLSDLAGNGNKGIVVSCEDNLTGVRRDAKLTIEGEGLSQSVVVQQTGGTVQLNDYFNDNTNNWYMSGVNDSMLYIITNGCFDFKNNCKNTTYAFAPKNVLSGTDNFVVNISYSRVSGTGGFGVSVGGSDWNNLYRIILYKNAYYVEKRDNGTYSTMIYPVSCSLNSTGNNNLRLVKINSSCDIYINDIKVNSFSISPYGGIVAYYLMVQTEINVDMMRITKF